MIESRTQAVLVLTSVSMTIIATIGPVLSTREGVVL